MGKNMSGRPQENGKHICGDVTGTRKVRDGLFYPIEKNGGSVLFEICHVFQQNDAGADLYQGHRWNREHAGNDAGIQRQEGLSNLSSLIRLCQIAAQMVKVVMPAKRKRKFVHKELEDMQVAQW